jgi:hypothetical protein
MAGLPTLCAGRSCNAIQEGVNIAKNTTTTFLDTTASPGPGIVDSMCFIVNTDDFVQLAYLRIYIDGATTPISIQFNHFGTYGQQINTEFHVPHMRSNFWSQSDTVVVSYPIPFKKSIKIVYDTAQCTSASTDIWANITYRLGVSSPWKFGFSGKGYDGRQVALTPAQQYARNIKFLDLPAGSNTKGIIAGLTVCMVNSSDAVKPDSWMETNVVVYQGPQARDGSVSPIFDGTGFEDFFNGAFYFEAGEGSFWTTMVSSKHHIGTNTANLTVHKDFLTVGGITFDDGCLFAMEQGLRGSPGVSTTNIDIFTGCWYYLWDPS